jgi:exodeoxyribonuclease (lambda-induced)
MPEIYGAQQSDAWLRAHCGRITGSGLDAVCAYLSRKSGDKKKGDPKAERDTYKLEKIGERLSGRLATHYETPAMRIGNEYEEEARLYYEGVLNVATTSVGFYVHDEYDFTGASCDALIDDDGVLEIKCPTTPVHLKYVMGGDIPKDYIPQVAWELACTGRAYVDFVSYGVGVLDDDLRFFYRRRGRTELEYSYTDYSGAEDREVKLTGEAVIEYFTNEVLKMENEIREFLKGRRTIAPFPVREKEVGNR